MAKHTAPRMERKSKLRRDAKRRLPQLLEKLGRATTAAHVAAKAKRESRELQRAKRVAVREERRKALASRRQEIEAQFKQQRPVFDEVDAPKPQEAAASSNAGDQTSG